VKKLLIITYYWPPAGGPGVQRWVKLSKYLSKLGYQCYVVTVDEQHASYPTTDASLQNEINASIKVTKTKSFEVLKIFSSLFKKEKVPYAGIPDKDKMSFVGRLALYVRSNFFIPDARVGWNKYALKACEEIISREKIDVIITTSPPHSTQLIGLILKQKFKNIKWLADLRDPWTDIYYYEKLSHTNTSKQKDLGLEKQILEQADGAITVSTDLKRLFLKKSDKIKENIISIIPNGFDEDDFTNTKSLPNKEFTIVHTGTINSNYNIQGFIKAINSVQLDQDFKIHFIGNVDAFIKQQLQNQVKKPVSFTPYVAHHDAINFMCNADLLLLAIPDNERNKGILTGKIFEYLASQKPILCLGPMDGDAASIINDCKVGQVFEFMDDAKMASYITEVYNLWKQNGTTQLQDTIYKKYSRKELAKQFAEIIEK